MKEKFLAFFTGKAGKAAYMIAASAAICAVAVVSTVVVVHNNNQKLNTALESLSALTSESESVTEPSTEAEQTQAVSAQAANGSSGGGDKAIQYLAEYNRLTEEYEKKRAALEQQTSVPEWNKVYADAVAAEKPYWESDEEYAQRLSEVAAENESRRNDYEAESASVAAVQEKANSAKSQLKKLEEQYQKDLAALKAKYGV